MCYFRLHHFSYLQVKSKKLNWFYLSDRHTLLSQGFKALSVFVCREQTRLLLTRLSSFIVPSSLWLNFPAAVNGRWCWILSAAQRDTLTLTDPVCSTDWRCVVRVKRQHMNNVICDQAGSLSGLKDRHNLFCCFVFSLFFFLAHVPVFCVFYINTIS